MSSVIATVAYGADLGDEIPNWLLNLLGVEDYWDEPEAETRLEDMGLSLTFYGDPGSGLNCVLCVDAAGAVAEGDETQEFSTEVKPEWEKIWDRVRKDAGDPKWLLFSNNG